MTYAHQLLHEKWLELRDARISMDFGMCQHCMSSRRLQVHHKYYVEGRMAWEYPLIALITLCDRCHENLHAQKKIGQATELDLTLERLDSNIKNLTAFIIKTANK